MVEEDLNAIHRNQYGVSTKRRDYIKKGRKKKKSKQPVLSLQHVLSIVQKILMHQVESVTPFVECPEEYNSLCKRIWLRLIVTSKPYLSTFTHIYPYTMTRIKPATPIAKEQKVDLLFPDTDVKLLSPNNRSDAPTPDIRTPSAPSSPALLPRTASPKLSLPPLDIPLSLPDSSAFTFSGMELPLSLRSLMSSKLTKSPARSASHSPKRSATSPRYSATNSPKRSAAGTPEHGKKRRRGSLTSGTFNVKSIHWDDDELVVYGQEKVFSLSGYQLQMISLLGILYAACRLLRMRFVARDFELCEPRESLTYSAAVDGVIPYVHCLAFLSHEDLLYVKPIKHWFSKIVLPSASRIEAEAWSICAEIGVSFSSLPVVPILHHVGFALHCPDCVNTLAERLLDSEASRPLRPRANEDATLLSLEDLTEEEWSQWRTSYENASLRRLCEQSVVYLTALLVTCAMILKQEEYVSTLTDFEGSPGDGFGLEGKVHIPRTTNHMSELNASQLASVIRKMERMVSLDPKVTATQIAMPSPSLKLPRDGAKPSYGVYHGLRSYQLHNLSFSQQRLVLFAAKTMGVEVPILTAHMRSVEYILTSREKHEMEKKKKSILASCI
ncbi:hypothetical protein BLSTO_02340 [Blastocystis sp. subtype 1]